MATHRSLCRASRRTGSITRDSAPAHAPVTARGHPDRSNRAASKYGKAGPAQLLCKRRVRSLGLCGAIIRISRARYLNNEAILKRKRFAFLQRSLKEIAEAAIVARRQLFHWIRGMIELQRGVEVGPDRELQKTPLQILAPKFAFGRGQVAGFAGAAMHFIARPEVDTRMLKVAR